MSATCGGSRLAAQHIHPSPSIDLSYTSLREDAKIHAEAKFSFAKEQRFIQRPVNGNLAPLLALSDEPGAWTGDLCGSPSPHVNTNTRTSFRDDFYPTHATMADQLSSPYSRSSPMRQGGHRAMSTMSVTDPRQQNLKPASDLGPGYYDEDPMHTLSTGTIPILPGSSHHMLPFQKDPTRPSAAFASQPREAKMGQCRDAHPDTTAIPFLSPDRADTQNSGSYQAFSTLPRETGLTGPLPLDVVYDNNSTTLSAYCSAPSSPSYKPAFQSALPRLMILSGGSRPDPRLTAKTHELLSSTSASTGPGSYFSLEPPRFKSFHSAYQGAQCYHSLAAGQPAYRPSTCDGSAVSPQQLASGAVRRDASMGWHSLPQSPVRAHPTSPLRRPGFPAISLPAHGSPLPGDKGEHVSAAATSQEAESDSDWAVHSALLRARYQTNGYYRPEHSSGAAASGPPLWAIPGAADGGSVGGPFGGSDPAGAGTDTGTGAESLSPSRRRAAGPLDKLVFLKREVPYKTVIANHLHVTAELKAARKAARKV